MTYPRAGARAEARSPHRCHASQRQRMSGALFGGTFKQKTAYAITESDWSSDCALPILVNSGLYSGSINNHGTETLWQAAKECHPLNSSFYGDVAGLSEGVLLILGITVGSSQHSVTCSGVGFDNPGLAVCRLTKHPNAWAKCAGEQLNAA